MFNPKRMLNSISKNHPQLWAVSYVEKENTLLQAEQDLNAAIEGGANAVVFINEFSSYDNLHAAIKYLRPKYPDVKIGANFLGDREEPYGFKGTFFLCKEYNLQIAWTDFSGVDLINERPPISLHAIEAERPKDVFYCSGVHMKYSTLIDSSKTLIQSAFQAMGWVDGILITGPKTGILASPDKIQNVRTAIGDYPLGLASGVSLENAHLIRDCIDFCLVGTSVFDDKNRIQKPKVELLINKLKFN